MAYKEYEFYNVKRTDYVLGSVVTFYDEPIKVTWQPIDSFLVGSEND